MKKFASDSVNKGYEDRKKKDASEEFTSSSYGAIRGILARKSALTLVTTLTQKRSK